MPHMPPGTSTSAQRVASGLQRQLQASLRPAACLVQPRCLLWLALTTLPPPLPLRGRSVVQSRALKMAALPRCADVDFHTQRHELRLLPLQMTLVWMQPLSQVPSATTMWSLSSHHDTSHDDERHGTL